MTVILQPLVEQWYARVRSGARRHLRRGAPPPFGDLEALGFLQLGCWSPSRPLDPLLHQVVAESDSTADQTWFPDDEWRQESATARDDISGRVATVVSYTVDHGESGPESRQFVLTVQASDYADSIAAQRLLLKDEHWRTVHEQFRTDGGATALRNGPPQSFFVALTISTPDGMCLALRRAAGAVATGRGLWSLGACETMGPLPERPGQDPENLFDLARRAAREELGLGPFDLGGIWYSWFGIARWDGPFAIAHTQVSLSPGEIQSRVEQSEGGYEADAVRWIHMNSPEFGTLTEPRLHDDWLPFTCLVASGLKRFHHVLDAQPARH